MANGVFKRKRVYFSQVSNTALRDKNLSLKAKGLYSLIQSYITLEDFTLYKNYLMAQCKERETAFDSAWKELKKIGYLKQIKYQDEKTGKWTYEYELLDEPEVENPGVENPPVGNPDVENIPHINKTSSNNTKINNTKKNKTSSSNPEEEVLLKRLYEKCIKNNINITREELKNLLLNYDNIKVIRMLNKVIASGSIVYNPHNYIATSLDNQINNSNQIPNKDSSNSDNIERVHGYTEKELEEALLGWE